MLPPVYICSQVIKLSCARRKFKDNSDIPLADDVICYLFMELCMSVPSVAAAQRDRQRVESDLCAGERGEVGIDGSCQLDACSEAERVMHRVYSDTDCDLLDIGLPADCTLWGQSKIAAHTFQGPITMGDTPRQPIGEPGKDMAGSDPDGTADSSVTASSRGLYTVLPPQFDMIYMAAKRAIPSLGAALCYVRDS